MADELETGNTEDNTQPSDPSISEGTDQGTSESGTEGTDPETPSTEEKLEQLQKDFDELEKEFDEAQDQIKDSKEQIVTLKESNEGYLVENKKLSDNIVEFKTLLKEAKELDVFQDKQLATYQNQILSLQDDIQNDESQTSLLSDISQTTQIIAKSTDSLLAGSGTVIYYGVYIIPLILVIVFINWFLKPFISPYR